MNCRKGDIAYLIRPWREESTLGRVVEVVRLARPGEVGKTRAGGETTAAGPGTGPAWLVDAGGPEFPCFAADCCLRPIRDQPGADESLSWAPVPTHKEPVPA